MQPWSRLSYQFFLLVIGKYQYYYRGKYPLATDLSVHLLLRLHAPIPSLQYYRSEIAIKIKYVNILDCRKAVV